VGDYYQSVGSCLSHQGQMNLVSDIYKYVNNTYFSVLHKSYLWVTWNISNWLLNISSARLSHMNLEWHLVNMDAEERYTLSGVYSCTLL
jgi:hypothetical protein